jgi:HD-like signal output (HDOD) protein
MEIKDKVLKLVRKDSTDLPTLPVTINKIIHVASDKNSSVEDLEQAIILDQAMTSKLLKLSNSIYYGQKSRVDTIKRAISVIGFDEIIGIALGMEILSSFDKTSATKINMDALWMHSIGVATASKEMGKLVHPSIATKIFIPALLHDIGKIFFSVFFSREYAVVQKFALDNGKPLYMAENAIFKLNHAALSALLMKRWKFPQSIEVPCRYHHHPESAPVKFQQHAAILHLADYITQMANIGGRGTGSLKTPEKSLTMLGINRQKLALFIDKLRKEENNINNFFEITTNG